MTEYPSSTKFTVGIIGAKGRMGSLMARMFKGDEHKVILCDKDTPLTPQDLVQQAQVIVLAVEMRNIEPITRQISALLTPQHLLCDVCSLKTEPLRIMLETKASVVGCHPIFSNHENIAGLPLVLCLSRPGKFAKWLTGFFERQKLDLIFLSPTEHDRYMATVQAATHIAHLSFAHYLSQSAIDQKMLVRLASPLLQRTIASLKTIFNNSGHTYSHIQVDNPHAQAERRKLIDSLSHLSAIADSSNLDDFDAIFEDIKNNLAEELD